MGERRLRKGDICLWLARPSSLESELCIIDHKTVLDYGIEIRIEGYGDVSYITSAKPEEIIWIGTL